MRLFLQLFICIICLQLIACSSRTTPAPVANLTSGKTSSQQKIKIKGSNYKVKKGETLYSIAFRSNKDFRDLAKINGIKAPYTIFPGQILQLNTPIKSQKKPKNYTDKTSKSTKNIQKNNNLLKKPLDPKKQQEYVENQASLKKQQKVVQSSDKLRWYWPAKGRVARKFSGKENGYKGILIKNKSGTDILAAADGIVVYAGSALRGYGNLIIVKHNDDYLTAYAHNQRILVKEKQKVTARQKIATMGNSEAKSVGLRFEVRYRGKSVDPLRYLPR
jgi:lipoprotein NlpD